MTSKLAGSLIALVTPFGCLAPRSMIRVERLGIAD